jgi:hypothetical protein
MNVSFNFRIPWLLVPLVISALLSYKCIQPGHNWGGDFALYIEQSEAIIQGELCELYELNKYSMDYSQYAVGPYLYPPVFPAMLIPIELWAGRNLMAMKWLCACCFLLGLFICWKLFLNNKTSPAAAGILLSMMAFHSAWVTFTDQVLSDLPFLLFTMLAFYMAERTKNWIGHLLTGIVVLLAMFTRSSINVPNENSLSNRNGRKNGSSTDITSSGFFLRKLFLSLEIVKFTIKSVAKQPHETHWIKSKLFCVCSFTLDTKAG